MAKSLTCAATLFSLGAVLYEMATGRLAFGMGTTAVVFEAILNRTPVPATRLNPDLLPDVGWIIAKLIEKDRRLRYQSAAELRADLRRIKRDSESSGVPALALPESAQVSLALSHNHSFCGESAPCWWCFWPWLRATGASDCRTYSPPREFTLSLYCPS